MLTAVTF